MPCVMSENFPTRVPASKHNCTKPLNVRRLGWEFYFSSAVGKKNLIPAYDLTWVTGNYCTTVRDLDDKRSDFKGGSESAKCGKIWLKQTSIHHKTYAANRTMDSGKNVDKNVRWFPRSAWEPAFSSSLHQHKRQEIRPCHPFPRRAWERDECLLIMHGKLFVLLLGWIRFRRFGIGAGGIGWGVLLGVPCGVFRFDHLKHK